MGYGVRVEARGEFALFTRPEMKTERVSYDCMTPSAARGLLEAVYWKPAIRYHIDRIHVCSPIRFTNIRRNEVGAKLLASSARAAMRGTAPPPVLYTSQNIQQRAAMVLRDVRYVIEAHFDLTERAGPDDTPEKHYNILLRRLRGGQCFHQPYFGCREFPARLRLIEDGEALPPTCGETRELGYMLYDMVYEPSGDIHPAFFRAALRGGVLDVADCEVIA